LTCNNCHFLTWKQHRRTFVS